MSRVVAAVRHLLTNPSSFSRLVIGIPLRSYQLNPLLAIIDSILHQRGLEFLVIMPRQSGKNEAVAHLLVYLLNLFQRSGGNIVYGAIGDGLGRGIARLEERLDNRWNRGRWTRATKPAKRSLGNASVVFLSTHPGAAARGETAHWLLVIDEMQDQDPVHLEAVFQPMRSANNASALYIGTVRTTTDSLWLKKSQLEAQEKQDGIQRVWIIHPDEVIAENPSYGLFLQNKIDELGRSHPIVASEYFNEPISGGAGLFTPERIQLMLGEHGRQSIPESGVTYFATLDVAGQDEAATDALAKLSSPSRDYTVSTVFKIISPQPDDPGPTYHAIDVFVDHGSRHFQNVPGQSRLADRLLAWLVHWNVQHLIADESGVGAGLVDWLAAKLGRDHVTGYSFSQQSKASLGSKYLSVVETGRFKYWNDDVIPLSDSWWFFQQVKACTYYLPLGGLFEKHLRWFVPDTAKVSTPTGPQSIHDDRLISAALVAIYDDLYRAGKLNLGQAKSAVIPPVDPLSDISF